MKKRFLVIAALIGLLAACLDPSDGKHNNQKTFIIFDNTQGISAAVVYDDYRRRDEDKIAEIPAGASSQEIAWTPSTSAPFYFSYRISIKGISGFILNYIPLEIGKDQTTVRIDANKKTTVIIPKLDETVSSPDLLLSNNSYILIQNNSSYSFQLHRGSSPINPDDSSNSLVISGERAQYTINPGAASNYRLLVGADYVNFSGSLVSFEAGRVYSFIFNNGALSLVSEVEIKLENVAGVSPNKSVPEVPGALVIAAFDSLLTVHWAAIEGAEKYEVYISTAQNPPALPERTVYSTATVLTGLTNKTAYYVWVKAVNENGASDFSPRTRGIPWSSYEVPATPGRPVIIPGVNQLTVNWEETGGASSYEVYINTTPSTPSLATSATEKTSVVINNLQNNVIYYIWVRAVNNMGRSGYSPFEAGTPQIPTIAPTAPAHPVLASRNKELAVSWQAVELAEDYEVWFGTSDDSTQAQKFGSDITGGVTETSITGLVNETTYYVWIKAKNVVGTSGFSSSANAVPSAFAVLPETPALPMVTVGSREVTVNWSPIEGALFYEVWTGATNNSAYAEKCGADIFGASVTLTGLNNGTTYYIWVKAKNNIGVSGFSPRASGTPSASAATPPDPQSAPTVTAGSGQLAISWQAVEGAASYEVWAGTANNSATATKRGNDVSSTSTAITGLSNGTTYYIWIKAKNSVGTSGFSPMASGTPQEINIGGKIPTAPTAGIGNGQISITWTAMEGATAYEVWLGTTNNSASAAKNGNDESDSLSRTISGLTNGTTYYMWIKAKNSISTSGFSPVASGKPIANAAAPTLTAANGQLTVNWTAIAGADQYEVFYGTGINPPQTASQTVTVTTATITSLTNGTIYNVWIRGKNSTGNGTMSSAASAKPIGNMGTVSLVSGNGRLSLSWSSVAGADEYEVYHNTSNSIPASPAQTVTATTATITGLANGTTYYVWIRAKNEFGTSGFSPSASGVPDEPGLYRISGAELIGNYNLTESLSYISSNAANGDDYLILLGANESISPATLDYSGKTVGITLRGFGGVRTVTLGSNGNMFTVNAGVTLTLDENITLSGRNANTSDTVVSLVYVASNGIFIMNSGAISGNTLSSSYAIRGGGVYVSGGTFAMNGGAVSGNTISSRLSANGGGVYVSGGTFTMNGGTISGNTVTSSEQSTGGGGVYVFGGTFTMNGGIISGNSAGGSSSSAGGGVYGGTFTMNGGAISGNTAGTLGGGVYVNGGTFTMYGGVISGNTAITGGGVYASGGTTRFYKQLIGSTSGIIYGSNAAGNDSNGVPLKNTAGSDGGHAIYGYATQYRNTTAGETDQIDTRTGMGLSANGNAPFGQ